MQNSHFIAFRFWIGEMKLHWLPSTSIHYPSQETCVVITDISLSDKLNTSLAWSESKRCERVEFRWIFSFITKYLQNIWTFWCSGLSEFIDPKSKLRIVWIKWFNDNWVLTIQKATLHVLNKKFHTFIRITMECLSHQNTGIVSLWQRLCLPLILHQNWKNLYYMLYPTTLVFPRHFSLRDNQRNKLLYNSPKEKL